MLSGSCWKVTTAQAWQTAGFMARAQPRSQNWGCPIHLSFQVPAPTNVQLQWSEALRGEEWGGGQEGPPPQPTRGLGERHISSPSVVTAANDFGAFRVQIYAISHIF